MGDGRLILIGLNGTEDGSLPLDQEECLTLESFAGLIHYYESKGKHLIVARVKSLDPENVHRFHYTYYCAYQLNKVLFRKKDNVILSRYNKKNPMVVLNPFTNEDIVGEVVYYIVQSHQLSPSMKKKELGSNITAAKPTHDLKVEPLSPQIKASSKTNVPTPGELRQPATLKYMPSSGAAKESEFEEYEYEGIAHPKITTQENPPQPVPLPNSVDEQIASQDQGAIRLDQNKQAVYIGTDYHFLYSDNLRKLFNDNGVEDDCVLLPVSSQMNSRSLANPPEDIEIAGLIRGIRSTYGRHRRGRLLYVPYPRAASYGAVLAFYFCSCIAVFGNSINNLRSGPENRDGLLWVWSFLPFVVFLADRFTTVIADGKEPKNHIVAKLLISVIYIFLPDFAFSRHSEHFFFCRNIISAVTPCIALVHSRWLYVRCSQGKIIL